MKIQLIVAVLILVALTASYYYGVQMKANLENEKVNVRLSGIPTLSIITFYCNENCTAADRHELIGRLLEGCDSSIDSMRACTERLSKNEDMKTKCVAYVDAVKELDSSQKGSNEILLFLDSLSGALTKEEVRYLGNSGVGLTPWKEKLSIAADKLQPCLDALRDYQDAAKAANPTA